MDAAIHRKTSTEKAAANEQLRPRSGTRGSRGDAEDSIPLFLLSATPLMRKAGCGCGSCPACAAKSLRISEPGDPLEREADTIAEQVMRKAAPAQAAPDSVRSVSEPPSGVVPTGGRELDAATRAFMEPRFGFDFSRVRIHDGPAGAQSAHAVSARAYTVGHHLVFGAGAYAPATHEGRRLIAHELAHVVQQASAHGGPVLQRDVKKGETKDPKQVAPTSQDVAVLFADEEGMRTTATVLAPGARILRVTSEDDLAKQLKAINGPIKTLYLIAHMLDDGNLVFDTPGAKTFKSAEMIADKIKGTAQVENINFQGCSIAQSPTEMQRIAVALKATKATGSNCALVEQTAPPVKVDGKPIIRPEQLADKRVKDAFEKGLKNARDLFVDKKKKCILNDTVDGYFAAGGKLIAYWANPESMGDDTGWDDTKSVCYKDLRVQKLDPTQKLPVIDPNDCRLIELTKKKP